MNCFHIASSSLSRAAVRRQVKDTLRQPCDIQDSLASLAR